MTNIIKQIMNIIYISKTINKLTIYKMLILYKNMKVNILIHIVKLNKKLIIINIYKNVDIYIINLQILFIMIDK